MTQSAVANWNPKFTIDESITHVGGEPPAHVQEGNYLLQLTKVTPSPRDRDYVGAKGKAQDPYVQGHFQIQDGPDGIGKTLRRTGMISTMNEDGRGGAWSLGGMLRALGMNVDALAAAFKKNPYLWPDYDHFVKWTAQVEKALLATGPQGKVGAEVADSAPTANPQTGKLDIFSNITAFFPAAEWELRKQNNVARGTPYSQIPPGTPYPSPALAVSPSPATGNGAASEPVPVGAPAEQPEMDFEAMVRSAFPQS